MKEQPAEVIFKYDQPVGGTDGAVRVYDSEGDEVDDGDVAHPGGRQSWLGVGLEPNLPDGTYTATYRVISADTHIVYGGLVFNLGHASANGGVTVAGLIGEEESGEVTKLGFGVVRFLDYLSIALMLGGLIFLAFAWRPGFGETRRPRVALGGRCCGPPPPRRAAARLRRRARDRRQPARDPPPGGDRGRRLALELAEKLDRRRHARKPLRHRLAAARDRLGGARRRCCSPS